MAREENNDTHQTIPTPNPRERALLVRVKEEVFAEAPDILPAEGSMVYGQMDRRLFGGDYKRQFENYVFTGQLPNIGTDAVISFAKNKTKEEKETPFRSTKETGNHYWPPMLLSIKFLRDPSFPQAIQGPSGETVFAPRYYVREVFIPGANEGTQFITEEFFAPTKFEIPQFVAPQPTAVSYDYLGVKGSFPECLHPKLNFPNLRSATATYTAGIGTGQAAGSIAGQVFPATNFEEWAPYYLSGKQELTSGGWYYIRIRVIPPAAPETIIR